jgi:hypothetical protein
MRQAQEPAVVEQPVVEQPVVEDPVVEQPPAPHVHRSVRHRRDV